MTAEQKSPFGQEVAGNWKQFKGKVQEEFGKLTDDELNRYEGKRDQLEGYIQEKTGQSREAIREFIDKIAKETKYRL